MPAKRAALSSEDTRHLLRRLTFAATPSMEPVVRGRTADEALDAILAAARRAPMPDPPPFVHDVWTNSALRLPGTSDPQYDAQRAAQVASNHRDIELIRQWWLGEMVGGSAPLRENLTLFFEGMFGSSTELVDVPHAIRLVSTTSRSDHSIVLRRRRSTRTSASSTNIDPYRIVASA